MKPIILVCIFLLSVGCADSQSVSNQTTVVPTDSIQTKEINEADAIKIAEKFIIENGYTDLPPTDDKKKLVFELIEWNSDIEEILKGRHNTLQKTAYGILKGRKGKTEGFTVVFLYVDGSNKKTGRAVTMDLDGKNIRVEHVDIFLKAVQKKL
jgi:hypothetical protein